MYGSWAGNIVILIQKDGNYLFRAVSHMHSNEDRHFEISLITLTKLSLSGSKDFIVNLSMIFRSEGYKNSLSIHEGV